MIVENHKLPKVTFKLTIDNLAEDSKKGVDELCNLIGSGNIKITKTTLTKK
jgi:hypothetical protein